MRKLRRIVALALLLGGCLNWQFASPLLGQQAVEAPAADAKAQPEAERELDIRYAEAYLKVMEATLARHEESNRIMANTVSPQVMQVIQGAVRKARERVELAKSDEAGDSQIYIASAEADLKVAEDLLRRAQAAVTRLPTAVRPGEIARLQAQVSFAKIRVEKAKHLAAESPLANVRYELELLREDVQELQIFVALMRRN